MTRVISRNNYIAAFHGVSRDIGKYFDRFDENESSAIDYGELWPKGPPNHDRNRFAHTVAQALSITDPKAAHDARIRNQKTDNSIAYNWIRENRSSIEPYYKDSMEKTLESVKILSGAQSADLPSLSDTLDLIKRNKNLELVHSSALFIALENLLSLKPIRIDFETKAAVERVLGRAGATDTSPPKKHIDRIIERLPQRVRVVAIGDLHVHVDTSAAAAAVVEHYTRQDRKAVVLVETVASIMNPMFKSLTELYSEQHDSEISAKAKVLIRTYMFELAQKYTSLNGIVHRFTPGHYDPSFHATENSLVRMMKSGAIIRGLDGFTLGVEPKKRENDMLKRVEAAMKDFPDRVVIIWAGSAHTSIDLSQARKEWASAQSVVAYSHMIGRIPPKSLGEMLSEKYSYFSVTWGGENAPQTLHLPVEDVVSP